MCLVQCRLLVSDLVDVLSAVLLWCCDAVSSLMLLLLSLSLLMMFCYLLGLSNAGSLGVLQLNCCFVGVGASAGLMKLSLC